MEEGATFSHLLPLLSCPDMTGRGRGRCLPAVVNDDGSAAGGHNGVGSDGGHGGGGGKWGIVD
ncbi:hypothetical protein Scep_015580 [Stephania cephalantha]|uniref:Uncharacterized protein n=1 Tax=Stephania cephalantha TaxID=152367 RepID=A0AAP0J3F1_9MAGN